METILQQIRTLVDTGKLVEDFDYRIRDGIVQFDAETLLEKLGGEKNVNLRQIEETPLFIGYRRAAFYQHRKLGAGIRERVTIEFTISFLTPPAGDCGVYCDKDTRGIYSIMELSLEDCEIIRKALIAYRTGLGYGETDQRSEFREQYDRAQSLLRAIERIL